MTRVMDENSDLKSKFEQLQQDEKDKFEELKKRLNLEFSIPSILKSKPNTKENTYIMLHVEADERSETLSKVNQNMNMKLKAMVKE
jgi:hypothetical protein